MSAGIQLAPDYEADEKILLDAEGSSQETTPDDGGGTQEQEQPAETVAPEAAPKEQEAPVEVAPPAEDAIELTKKLQAQVENLNKALYEQRVKVREFKQYVENHRNQIKEPEAPKIPDYNESPLEHLKTNDEITAATLRSIAEEQSRIKSQIEATNIISNIANMEQTFRRSTPDYDEAFNYLIDFRKKELSLMGITDEEAQVNEIRGNSAALSRAALAQGKNPAEVVYSLAKQYGYKKPEAAPVVPKAEVAKAHLDTVQAAQQKAGKTLSNAGATDVNATYESVLSAKGQDFEKQWKELFGEY